MKISPLTSYLSSCNSRCKECASVENSVGNNYNCSSVTYFGRNICDTVKNLMKDVIVSESNAKYDHGTGVEWMTVSSFIKKISSPPTSPKDNESNITNEEIEVKNEALGGPKKDDFALYVKTLLNKVVLGKVLETPTKLKTHSNLEDKSSHSSSLSATLRRERGINEILNLQMNGNDSSQNLLSDSSIPIKANKTKEHGKCLKYFIETVLKKSECPNAEIYGREDSKSRFINENINNTSTKNQRTRKSMHLHAYLCENFVKNEISASKQLDKYFMVPEIQKSPKLKMHHSRKFK